MHKSGQLAASLSVGERDSAEQLGQWEECKIIIRKLHPIAGQVCLEDS